VSAGRPHQLRAAGLRTWPALPEFLDVVASALEAWSSGQLEELDSHLDAAHQLLAKLHEAQRQGRPPWDE